MPATTAGLGCEHLRVSSPSTTLPVRPCRSISDTDDGRDTACFGRGHVRRASAFPNGDATRGLQAGERGWDARRVEDSYIIRGGLAGRERLRVLARAMHPTTSALFDRVGIAAGMRCLDVGSGGGDVTRELARRVAPGGQAVGIDRDSTKVAIAREEARGDTDVVLEYREADVLTIELAPEYDVIYARFLLTHMGDPGAVAARLAEGLAPGGVLIVEDIDHSGCFCHPSQVAYHRYVQLYTEAARARGADPDIGPRLPQLLVAAGCERIQVNVVQPAGMTPEGHEGDVKLVIAMTLENIADSAVSQGLTTPQEIEAVVAELYRLASDTATLLACPRIVQAWGYRAAEQPHAKSGS